MIDMTPEDRRWLEEMVGRISDNIENNKENIDLRILGLSGEMKSNFNLTNFQLEEIKKQVILTNSRVNKLEEKEKGSYPRLVAVEKEMKGILKETEEVRFFNRHPRFLKLILWLIGLISAGSFALQIIQKLIK
jgi:hypothetical protein